MYPEEHLMEFSRTAKQNVLAARIMVMEQRCSSPAVV
jgi:hypothetical protein